MGDRWVSDTAYLAAMLIAIIGLSVLPATFIASILSKSSVGEAETAQNGLIFTKPVLLDGFQGVQRPANKTVVTETHEKQMTQTVQIARAPALARGLQISDGASPGEEEKENPLATAEPSQSLIKDSDSASQGVYSASPDLRLYSDSACTQTFGSIDWGLVYPGGTVSRSVYVKNVGSSKVTLSLSVANWYPAAANGPLSVTWNGQNVVLGPNLVFDATLKLSVSFDIGSIGTTFGFDIVISGSG